MDRHLRLQQIEDQAKIAKERKKQQFDKALEKANLDSLKLKFQAEDVEVCLILCCSRTSVFNRKMKSCLKL